MKSIQSLRFALLAVVFVVIQLFGMPVKASDDAASDFEAAWNRRRTVAPYVRCRMETVRVIRAMTLGEDFDFPPEDITVDEDSEYLVDISKRRIRSESHYFFMAGKSLQKRHAITQYTPESIVSYTLSMDGKSAAMSLPTIYETPDHSRARKLDAIFNFEPPMWAMGYMTASDMDRSKFDRAHREFVQQSGQLLVVSATDTPFLRYDVDVDKDFALKRCALYPSNSTTFDADATGLSIDVTWEHLAQGWYPRSWQLDIGSEQKSTEVLEWQFLDNIADDLWNEPMGVRERGRLIYTKDGARRLDDDLAIIPAGSYQEPKSWANRVVVLALVSAVAFVLYWRRKVRSA